MAGGPKQKNIDGLKAGAGIGIGRTKDDVLLSWQAYDIDLKPKTGNWYLIAAILIVVAIAYLVWQRDYFTIAILLIISGVGYWYLRNTKPKLSTYKLTPLGIYRDERLYPFSEIHSFWMVYNEKVKKLNIAFVRKYLPALQIGLEKVDPVILKNLLLTKIPEQEKRGESLTDKITRLVGF